MRTRQRKGARASARASLLNVPRCFALFALYLFIVWPMASGEAFAQDDDPVQGILDQLRSGGPVNANDLDQLSDGDLTNLMQQLNPSELQQVVPKLSPGDIGNLLQNGQFPQQGLSVLTAEQLAGNLNRISTFDLLDFDQAALAQALVQQFSLGSFTFDLGGVHGCSLTVEGRLQCSIGGVQTAPLNFQEIGQHNAGTGEKIIGLKVEGNGDIRLLYANKPEIVLGNGITEVAIIDGGVRVGSGTEAMEVLSGHVSRDGARYLLGDKTEVMVHGITFIAEDLNGQTSVAFQNNQVQFHGAGRFGGSYEGSKLLEADSTLTFTFDGEKVTAFEGHKALYDHAGHRIQGDFNAVFEHEIVQKKNAQGAVEQEFEIENLKVTLLADNPDSAYTHSGTTVRVQGQDVTVTACGSVQGWSGLCGAGVELQTALSEAKEFQQDLNTLEQLKQQGKWSEINRITGARGQQCNDDASCTAAIAAFQQLYEQKRAAIAFSGNTVYVSGDGNWLSTGITQVEFTEEKDGRAFRRIFTSSEGKTIAYGAMGEEIILDNVNPGLTGPFAHLDMEVGFQVFIEDPPGSGQGRYEFRKLEELKPGEADLYISAQFTKAQDGIHTMFDASEFSRLQELSQDPNVGKFLAVPDFRITPMDAVNSITFNRDMTHAFVSVGQLGADGKLHGSVGIGALEEKVQEYQHLRAEYAGLREIMQEVGGIEKLTEDEKRKLGEAARLGGPIDSYYEELNGENTKLTGALSGLKGVDQAAVQQLITANKLNAQGNTAGALTAYAGVTGTYGTYAQEKSGDIYSRQQDYAHASNSYLAALAGKDDDQVRLKLLQSYIGAKDNTGIQAQYNLLNAKGGETASRANAAYAGFLEQSGKAEEAIQYYANAYQTASAADKQSIAKSLVRAMASATDSTVSGKDLASMTAADYGAQLDQLLNSGTFAQQLKDINVAEFRNTYIAAQLAEAAGGIASGNIDARVKLLEQSVSAEAGYGNLMQLAAAYRQQGNLRLAELTRQHAEQVLNEESRKAGYTYDAGREQQRIGLKLEEAQLRYAEGAKNGDFAAAFTVLKDIHSNYDAQNGAVKDISNAIILQQLLTGKVREGKANYDQFKDLLAGSDAEKLLDNAQAMVLLEAAQKNLEKVAQQKAAGKPIDNFAEARASMQILQAKQAAGIALTAAEEKQLGELRKFVEAGDVQYSIMRDLDPLLKEGKTDEAFQKIKEIRQKYGTSAQLDSIDMQLQVQQKLAEGNQNGNRFAEARAIVAKFAGGDSELAKFANQLGMQVGIEEAFANGNLVDLQRYRGQLREIDPKQAAQYVMYEAQLIANGAVGSAQYSEMRKLLTEIAGKGYQIETKDGSMDLEQAIKEQFAGAVYNEIAKRAGEGKPYDDLLSQIPVELRELKITDEGPTSIVALVQALGEQGKPKTPEKSLEQQIAEAAQSYTAAEGQRQQEFGAAYDHAQTGSEINAVQRNFDEQAEGLKSAFADAVFNAAKDTDRKVLDTQIRTLEQKADRSEQEDLALRELRMAKEFQQLTAGKSLGDFSHLLFQVSGTVAKAEDDQNAVLDFFGAGGKEQAAYQEELLSRVRGEYQHRILQEFQAGKLTEEQIKGMLQTAEGGSTGGIPQLNWFTDIFSNADDVARNQLDTTDKTQVTAIQDALRYIKAEQDRPATIGTDAFGMVVALRGNSEDYSNNEEEIAWTLEHDKENAARLNYLYGERARLSAIGEVLDRQTMQITNLPPLAAEALTRERFAHIDTTMAGSLDTVDLQNSQYLSPFEQMNGPMDWLRGVWTTGVWTSVKGISGNVDDRLQEFETARAEFYQQSTERQYVLGVLETAGVTIAEFEQMDAAARQQLVNQYFSQREGGGATPTSDTQRARLGAILDHAQQSNLLAPPALGSTNMLIVPETVANGAVGNFVDAMLNVQTSVVMTGFSAGLGAGTGAAVRTLEGLGKGGSIIAAGATETGIAAAADAGWITRTLTTLAAGDNIGSATIRTIARGVEVTSNKLLGGAEWVSTTKLNPFVWSQTLEEGTLKALSESPIASQIFGIVRNAEGELVTNPFGGILKYYAFEIGVEEGAYSNIGGNAADDLELISGARRGAVALNIVQTLTNGKVTNYASQDLDITTEMNKYRSTEYHEAGYRVQERANENGKVTAIEITRPESMGGGTFIIAVKGSTFDRQQVKLTDTGTVLETPELGSIHLVSVSTLDGIRQLGGSAVTLTTTDGNTIQGTLVEQNGVQQIYAAVEPGNQGDIHQLTLGPRTMGVRVESTVDQITDSISGRTGSTTELEGSIGARTANGFWSDVFSNGWNSEVQELITAPFNAVLTGDIQRLFTSDATAARQIAVEAVRALRTENPVAALQHLQELGLIDRNYGVMVENPALQRMVEQTKQNALRLNAKLEARFSASVTELNGLIREAMDEGNEKVAAQLTEQRDAFAKALADVQAQTKGILGAGQAVTAQERYEQQRRAEQQRLSALARQQNGQPSDEGTPSAAPTTPTPSPTTTPPTTPTTPPTQTPNSGPTPVSSTAPTPNSVAATAAAQTQAIQKRIHAIETNDLTQESDSGFNPQQRLAELRAELDRYQRERDLATALNTAAARGSTPTEPILDMVNARTQAEDARKTVDAFQQADTAEDRIAAMNGMPLAGAPDVTLGVLMIAATNPDLTKLERAYAADALGQVAKQADEKAKQQATAQLAKVLANPQATSLERWAAANALRMIGTLGAAEVLTKQLNAEDPTLRALAIRSIAQLQNLDPEKTEGYVKQAMDEDPAVRKQAMDEFVPLINQEGLKNAAKMGLAPIIESPAMENVDLAFLDGTQTPSLITAVQNAQQTLAQLGLSQQAISELTLAEIVDKVGLTNADQARDIATAVKFAASKIAIAQELKAAGIAQYVQPEALPNIIAGLALLNTHSGHYQDARHIAAQMPEGKARIAAYLHDIGKIGPPNAPTAAQTSMAELSEESAAIDYALQANAVLQLYEVETPVSNEERDTITIDAFIDRTVPNVQQREQILTGLQQVTNPFTGKPFAPTDRMVEFWRAHPHYDHQWLSGTVDAQVVQIAVSHHLLDSVDGLPVNPEGVFFSRLSNTQQEDILRLIIGDKMDGLIHRAGLTPQRAAEVIAKLMLSNPIVLTAKEIRAARGDKPGLAQRIDVLITEALDTEIQNGVSLGTVPTPELTTKKITGTAERSHAAEVLQKIDARQASVEDVEEMFTSIDQTQLTDKTEREAVVQPLRELRSRLSDIATHGGIEVGTGIERAVNQLLHEKAVEFYVLQVPFGTANKIGGKALGDALGKRTVEYFRSQGVEFSMSGTRFRISVPKGGTIKGRTIEDIIRGFPNAVAKPLAQDQEFKSLPRAGDIAQFAMYSGREEVSLEKILEPGEVTREHIDKLKTEIDADQTLITHLEGQQHTLSTIEDAALKATQDEMIRRAQANVRLLQKEINLYNAMLAGAANVGELKEELAELMVVYRFNVATSKSEEGVRRRELIYQGEYRYGEGHIPEFVYDINPDGTEGSQHGRLFRANNEIGYLFARVMDPVDTTGFNGLVTQYIRALNAYANQELSETDALATLWTLPEFTDMATRIFADVQSRADALPVLLALRQKVATRVGEFYARSIMNPRYPGAYREDYFSIGVREIAAQHGSAQLAFLEIDGFNAFNRMYPPDGVDSDYHNILDIIRFEAQRAGIDLALTKAGDEITIAVPGNLPAETLNTYLKAVQEKIQEKFGNRPFQETRKIRNSEGVEERVPGWIHADRSVEWLTTAQYDAQYPFGGPVPKLTTLGLTMVTDTKTVLSKFIDAAGVHAEQVRLENLNTRVKGYAKGTIQDAEAVFAHQQTLEEAAQSVVDSATEDIFNPEGELATLMNDVVDRIILEHNPIYEEPSLPAQSIGAGETLEGAPPAIVEEVTPGGLIVTAETLENVPPRGVEAPSAALAEEAITVQMVPIVPSQPTAVSELPQRLRSILEVGAYPEQLEMLRDLEVFAVLMGQKPAWFEKGLTAEQQSRAEIVVTKLPSLAERLGVNLHLQVYRSAAGIHGFILFNPTQVTDLVMHSALFSEAERQEAAADIDTFVKRIGTTSDDRLGLILGYPSADVAVYTKAMEIIRRHKILPVDAEAGRFPTGVTTEEQKIVQQYVQAKSAKIDGMGESSIGWNSINLESPETKAALARYRQAADLQRSFAELLGAGEVAQSVQTPAEAPQAEKLPLPAILPADIENFYDRLGVSPTASQAEIRKAYRALAKLWHPDVNAYGVSVEETLRNAKAVNEAYETLSDPDKRAAYDQGGAVPRTSAVEDMYQYRARMQQTENIEELIDLLWEMGEVTGASGTYTATALIDKIEAIEQSIRDAVARGAMEGELRILIRVQIDTITNGVMPDGSSFGLRAKTTEFLNTFAQQAFERQTKLDAINTLRVGDKIVSNSGTVREVLAVDGDTIRVRRTATENGKTVVTEETLLKSQLNINAIDRIEKAPEAPPAPKTKPLTDLHAGESVTLTFTVADGKGGTKTVTIAGKLNVRPEVGTDRGRLIREGVMLMSDIRDVTTLTIHAADGKFYRVTEKSSDYSGVEYTIEEIEVQKPGAFTNVRNAIANMLPRTTGATLLWSIFTGPGVIPAKILAKWITPAAKGERVVQTWRAYTPSLEERIAVDSGAQQFEVRPQDTPKVPFRYRVGQYLASPTLVIGGIVGFGNGFLQTIASPELYASQAHSPWMSAFAIGAGIGTYVINSVLGERARAGMVQPISDLELHTRQTYQDRARDYVASEGVDPKFVDDARQCRSQCLLQGSDEYATRIANAAEQYLPTLAQATQLLGEPTIRLAIAENVAENLEDAVNRANRERLETGVVADISAAAEGSFFSAEDIADILGALTPESRVAAEATLKVAQGTIQVGKLQPGMQIGAYRITDKLAEGGQGVVYHVVDSTGTPLVMKIAKQVENRDTVGMLRREDQIMERVAFGPAGVAVQEFRDAVPELGGAAMLVMESLDGGTLWDRVQQRAAGTLEEKVRNARKLAEQVQLLHSIGYRHRDLKPKNVMFHNGEVRLVDYGIAKTATEKLEGYSGSPAWSDPRQLQGIDVGVAGDVYSLGMVYYYWFSGGSVPIQGMQRVEATPIPGISDGLITLILSMIDLDSTKRPTMAEVVRVLDDVEFQIEIDASLDTIGEHVATASAQVRGTEEDFLKTNGLENDCSDCIVLIRQIDQLIKRGLIAEALAYLEPHRDAKSNKIVINTEQGKIEIAAHQYAQAIGSLARAMQNLKPYVDDNVNGAESLYRDLQQFSAVVLQELEHQEGVVRVAPVHGVDELRRRLDAVSPVIEEQVKRCGGGWQNCGASAMFMTSVASQVLQNVEVAIGRGRYYEAHTTEAQHALQQLRMLADASQLPDEGLFDAVRDIANGQLNTESIATLDEFAKERYGALLAAIETNGIDVQQLAAALQAIEPRVMHDVAFVRQGEKTYLIDLTAKQFGEDKPTVVFIEATPENLAANGYAFMIPRTAFSTQPTDGNGNPRTPEQIALAVREFGKLESWQGVESPNRAGTQRRSLEMWIVHMRESIRELFGFESKAFDALQQWDNPYAGMALFPITFTSEQIAAELGVTAKAFTTMSQADRTTAVRTYRRKLSETLGEDLEIELVDLAFGIRAEEWNTLSLYERATRVRAFKAEQDRIETAKRRESAEMFKLRITPLLNELASEGYHLTDEEADELLRVNGWREEGAVALYRHLASLTFPQTRTDTFLSHTIAFFMTQGDSHDEAIIHAIAALNFNDLYKQDRILSGYLEPELTARADRGILPDEPTRAISAESLEREGITIYHNDHLEPLERILTSGFVKSSAQVEAEGGNLNSLHQAGMSEIYFRFGREHFTEKVPRNREDQEWYIFDPQYNNKQLSASRYASAYARYGEIMTIWDPAIVEGTQEISPADTGALGSVDRRIMSLDGLVSAVENAEALDTLLGEVTSQMHPELIKSEAIPTTYIRSFIVPETHLYAFVTMMERVYGEDTSWRQKVLVAPVREGKVLYKAAFDTPAQYSLEAYGERRMSDIREATSPHDLIAFLEQTGFQYTGRPLSALFAADAGVSQGFTIKDHTERALKILEKQYTDAMLPLAEPIPTQQFLRIFLALHDVGKPIALEKGNKNLQYGENAAVMRMVLEQLGFPESQIRLAEELVGSDVLGEAVRGKRTPEEAFAQIAQSAQRVGLSTETYFDLLVRFYTADAASYPEIDQLVFDRTPEGRKIKSPGFFYLKILIDEAAAQSEAMSFTPSQIAVGTTTLTLPSYNPADQLSLPQSDDWRKEAAGSPVYLDNPQLYVASVESTRVKRLMLKKMNELNTHLFPPMYLGGLGLDNALEAIDSEVGVNFDAHGIEKGDPLRDMDALLTKGVDPNRILYTMEFFKHTGLSGAYGSETPKTGGGIILVSEYGKLVKNGIRYVVLDERFMRVIDLFRKAYPEVQFIPWHDAPKVLTEEFNRQTGLNKPIPVVDAEFRMAPKGVRAPEPIITPPGDDPQSRDIIFDSPWEASTTDIVVVGTTTLPSGEIQVDTPTTDAAIAETGLTKEELAQAVEDLTPEDDDCVPGSIKCALKSGVGMEHEQHVEESIARILQEPLIRGTVATTIREEQQQQGALEELLSMPPLGTSQLEKAAAPRGVWVTTKEGRRRFLTTEIRDYPLGFRSPEAYAAYRAEVKQRVANLEQRLSIATPLHVELYGSAATGVSSKTGEFVETPHDLDFVVINNELYDQLMDQAAQLGREGRLPRFHQREEEYFRRRGMYLIKDPQVLPEFGPALFASEQIEPGIYISVMVARSDSMAAQRQMITLSP